MMKSIWVVCERLMDDEPELIGWFDTELDAERFIMNRRKSYGDSVKYMYCWSVEVEKK